ncbi:MAG: hypothetical protein EXR71_08265 [Myxococcales bacterium]|nr:hypothetical protein [Myxococcales bacterium]
MLGTLVLALVRASNAAEPNAAAANAELPAPVLIGGAALVAVAVAILLARKAVDGMLAASAAGAITAMYLTVQHFVAMHGGSSICTLSAIINCDKVNTSPHSALFGTPISLFGLGFYAGMGYLAYRSRAGRTQTAPALMLVGACCAIGYDVFLAWISYKLGAICVFCALSWALNLLLLVGAARLVVEMEADFPTALGRSLVGDAGPAAIMGLSVFLIGVLVVKQQEAAQLPGGGGDTASGETGDFRPGLVENVRGVLTTDGTEPVRGDPAARFTIVEFADFECPHCGAFAPILKKLLSENHDVKLLFKNYPLSMTCNPHMDRAMHPNACGAAASAECARIQGRFWELSEAMFQDQEFLAPQDISFMAKRAGLDVPAFEECVASAAAAEAVKADLDAGWRAQIDGTPALFIHGAYGEKWVRLEVSPGDKEVITAFLDAARTGKPLPVPVDPEPWPAE